MLFCSCACIITEKSAKLLEAYVRWNGTLILGCRTAHKGETGKCVMQLQPELLRTLNGTDASEFTFASPAEKGPILFVTVCRSIRQLFQGRGGPGRICLRRGSCAARGTAFSVGATSILFFVSQLKMQKHP